MRVHLDTDFLVRALSVRGPERSTLEMVLSGEAHVQVSALVWYEFRRGPRSPSQLAVAEHLVGEDVVPIDGSVAAAAAELYRSMGSPRRRAADVLVAAAAVAHDAVLWTCNAADYSDVPGVRLGP